MQSLPCASHPSPLADVSDDALLLELAATVGAHRRVTAELVAYLAEVDARRLYAEQGFSSLFGYCVARLRFSEDEACRRIDAARLVRRFPAIYPLLTTGGLSLTVLGQLKPHLTAGNHTELLAGVAGASVRDAKEWLAARFPQADVPSSIRKLSVPASPATPGPFVTASEASGASAFPTPDAGAIAVPTRVERPYAAASARGRLEPLSQDRFLVKFTASRAMKEKLELASGLMSHANPGREIATIVERALDVLIVALEKTRQGRTTRPRQEPRRGNEVAESRSLVTRATQREVVARDGWRCSFVGHDGQRCDTRDFLEFDHRTPKGIGGTSHPSNLRLLCRTHNRAAAEVTYGKAYVSDSIARADARRRAAQQAAQHTSQGPASPGVRPRSAHEFGGTGPASAPQGTT